LPLLPNLIRIYLIYYIKFVGTDGALGLEALWRPLSVSEMVEKSGGEAVVGPKKGAAEPQVETEQDQMVAG